MFLYTKIQNYFLLQSWAHGGCPWGLSIKAKGAYFVGGSHGDAGPQI